MELFRSIVCSPEALIGFALLQTLISQVDPKKMKDTTTEIAANIHTSLNNVKSKARIADLANEVNKNKARTR